MCPFLGRAGRGIFQLGITDTVGKVSVLFLTTNKVKKMNSLQNKLKSKSEATFNERDLFRNEDGAIDLASIMVGVIVIGLIGGVIAATVFAVIPWAQDMAAKHQLESIHTAENAYFGFSSTSLNSLPVGAKQNSFAASAELEAASLLSQNKNYCAAVPADSKTYKAYSLSGTGKIWTSDDKKAKPTVFSGTLPSACPDLIAESTRVGSTSSDGNTTYSYGTDGSSIQDISSPGMGDGKTAATSGTITGDGSGSYFPKNNSWLWSGYGTPMPNTLPSPVLDLSGWSYNSASRSVGITFKTDGSFTGVGGSWIYLMNVDISCYDTSTKTFTHAAYAPAASLRGPYFSSDPGPNSSGISVNCGAGTPATMVPSQVLVRTATDSEWANYSLGRLGYVYSMPNLSEGWVNPAVPQE